MTDAYVSSCKVVPTDDPYPFRDMKMRDSIEVDTLTDSTDRLPSSKVTSDYIQSALSQVPLQFPLHLNASTSVISEKLVFTTSKTVVTIVKDTTSPEFGTLTFSN